MASTQEDWIVEAHFRNNESESRSGSQAETSFFEFWPMWLVYAPVALQWLGLALKYRSFTLPFLANPRITLSGMVGMPKSEILGQATGSLRQHILPWIAYTKTDAPLSEQIDQLLEKATAAGIQLPCVCKPDIGCRGVGVKRVDSREKLKTIVEDYPIGARLLIQKLAHNEPEAGVFFVKNPESGEASVPSMTFKFTPRVTGDGQATLAELVGRDSRASQLIHLYRERHLDRWDTVIPDGEMIKLVFSASHSKGAVFKDARAFVTPLLIEKIGDLMAGLPDFYYGRLDLKFPDVRCLQRGEGLEILEINGASSESIHIWDKDARFGESIRQLLWQYRTLFEIGASHRKRGMRPPTLRFFFERLSEERRLTRSYPLTD